MAFLDHLPDKEMKTFPTLDRSSRRQFIIKLEITAECPPDLDNISRWLDRFRRGCKGSEIEFVYEGLENDYGNTTGSLQSLFSKRIVDDVDFALTLEVVMIRLALAWAGDDYPLNRDSFVNRRGPRFQSRRETLEHVVQNMRAGEIRAMREGWRAKWNRKIWYCYSL
jgi:hypothetical protein